VLFLNWPGTIVDRFGESGLSVAILAGLGCCLAGIMIWNRQEAKQFRASDRQNITTDIAILTVLILVQVVSVRLFASITRITLLRDLTNQSFSAVLMLSVWATISCFLAYWTYQSTKDPTERSRPSGPSVPAIIALIALVVASALLVSSYYGSYKAYVMKGYSMRLEGSGVRDRDYGFPALGVRAYRVCISWLDGTRPDALNQQGRSPLFYLGQVNQTLVLYDSINRQAIRLPSGKAAITLPSKDNKCPESQGNATKAGTPVKKKP
jgi:uncharacterized membrane protein YidH (DUF202 family)